MASIFGLLYKWEIQVLVVLSFMLQVFLFFTGCLRRRSNNMSLRLLIWLAYLGADLIAVYALGYLSNHEPTTGRDTLVVAQQLAFLWAPFLLIHLGGQDTVTAFSQEDNSLWLRHLLNLVVQAVLALYVFWKSIGYHNKQLQVTGIFLFVAGIIKYGERTLALKYGDLGNTRIYDYEMEYVENRPRNYGNDRYSELVGSALHSLPVMRDLFAGCTIYNIPPSQAEPLEYLRELNEEDVLKLLEVELALVYDDLYSKAKVLRTRMGIILRFISQVSMVVAFVLFNGSRLQQYNRADVAITNILFVGGIVLEGCAMFVMVMLSPWVWGWLEARSRLHRLAGMSWYLFSSNVGWPMKRPLWSNSMGQFSYDDNDNDPSRLPHHVIKWMASMFRLKDETLIWVSKIIDTEYVPVDDNIMKDVLRLLRAFDSVTAPTPPSWPNLGPLLQDIIDRSAEMTLGDQIFYLHVFTGEHLKKYRRAARANAADASTNTTANIVNGLVDKCRKLSNYMLYVFASQPSMLRDTGIIHDTLQGYINDSDFQESNRRWRFHDPRPCQETLEEVKEMWVRFILYVAGRSRPEAHAAQLARGGELLTFAWLLMFHTAVHARDRPRMELSDAFQQWPRPTRADHPR